MIKQFTQEEYNAAKSTTLLPLVCEYCNNTFYKAKYDIRGFINPNKHNVTGSFCSKKCAGKSRVTKQTISCLNCNKSFLKLPSQIKKYSNHFCSRSCAATFNNKHKKHGTRISKLEMWLQEQLNNLYPDLDIHFNRKDAIQSELDIYIPSLNIAFELNGIFHYEPIFGKDKLEKIQNNDSNKFLSCINAKINLCIIDTTHQKVFNPKTSFKYLSIITELIDNQ